MNWPGTRDSLPPRASRPRPIAIPITRPVEMPTPPATDGASGKRVLREVGETMLMIEAAITRAQRAMEAVRRKLHQAVYL